MKELVHALTAMGPVGVFLLGILDSAGIPLPAGVDGLLLLLAAAEPETAYYSAISAIVGSSIGNLILFGIARKGGETYLERFTAAGRGARFREWFLQYGLITIFIPAFVPLVPLPLKIFVISAGAMGVHPMAFIAVVVAARIPRYLGLAYLGHQLGENSMDYLKSHARELLLISLALFVFLFALVKATSWFRARRSLTERA